MRTSSRNSHPVLFRCGLVAAALVAATTAAADPCRNTCVTMAVPSAEGVRTRLDGTADAILWPPTQELRPIRLSALNDAGRPCDVTIADVRQDEMPRISASGATIYDASNCSNDGNASSIELRSDRDEDGDGRAYRIGVNLADPDCRATGRSDEVLIAVPIEEPTTAELVSYEDQPVVAASYPGPDLQCDSPSDDRLASGAAR